MDRIRKKAKPNSKQIAARRADRWHSKYIRLRDMQADRTFVCISCGRWLPIGEADCGHYISRRHMSLRYSTLNCHAQCRTCNRFEEGNIGAYRERLTAKIGADNVAYLESKKRESRQYTEADLNQVADRFHRLYDELSVQKGAL